MPAPVPAQLRERIWKRLEKEHSPAAIARDLGLCPRTVRHLCRRFHQRGAGALETSYQAPAPATASEAIEQALLIHKEHPSWGAEFVLHKLQSLHAADELPSVRTLQRWFRRFELPAAPAGRKPASIGPTAERPHGVWETDGVEQLALQTGQLVSWLRHVDEYCGATLGTVVFPLRDVRRSAGHPGPRRFSPAISAVGSAGLAACGQWHSVGQLERSADRVRSVADRPWRVVALERSV